MFLWLINYYTLDLTLGLTVYVFMCLFLYVQRSTLWQDDGISSQGSVYLPNTGRQASATKENCSQLTAVIKSGWLDKNPPQGYE